MHYIFNRSNPKKPYSVQLARDNHDIKVNPAVREKYPTLYTEVVDHDRDSFSSWYNFSQKAFDEYRIYVEDKDIPYIS